MFYELGVKEVFKKLNTSESGLKDDEARKRLGKYGYNVLEEKNKFSPFKLFFSQFYDILVLILIIAALISFFLKKYIDSIVIWAIIVLNAIVGFIQEYKAEKSIELLKKLSVPKSKVIRDGKIKIISSKELVPGDVILLELGDKVNADCRLFEAINLKVDEAILTGESTSVTKHVLHVEAKAAISEQTNMLFSGTTIVNGRGQAIVVSTGMKTELGNIANLIQEVQVTETTLQRKLKKLGKKLAILTVVISVLIFGIGILRGLGFLEMLLSAIALAVAVIPEGLPAVVTISLAIGVQKMLKRNALIRRLRAIETLGSITVINSDKTGTITKNEMTVKKLFVNNKEIYVTGTGYNLNGNFIHKGKKVDSHNFIDLLNVCASCNNANLPDIGDPTEIALLVLAKKGKVNKIEKRVHEIPFDSIKKYMSTTHKINHEEINYIKGAPEIVLDFCDYIEIDGKIKKLNAIEKKNILNKNIEMSSEALRVLGTCYKKHGKTVFLGLVGMIDPPRHEVKEAIKLASRAGIRTIMITGDHKNTAKAVAHEVGIKGDVVEGSEINESNINELVKNNSIFARVDPEHKVMILESLQKKDEIVAMTGDGVNDAPALKKADVGISMSIKGTDIARDASDMVLVDDNFATIVKSIKEGRVTYDNIKKFVKFLLSANIGEVGIIFFSLVLNLPLPLLPLQLLWVNLVTDSLPALALGVDTPSKDIMKRKPRSKDETILKGTGSFIILAGILSTVIVLGLFYFNLDGGITKARTIALTSLIFFELFLVFSCRSEKQSLFKLKVNKWLIYAVLVSVLIHLTIIYTPLNSAFKLVPLSLIDWIWIVLLSSLGLVFFEVKKAIWH